MFPWRQALLLPILLATVSCASALTGTHEAIAVDSMPAGADATLICGGTHTVSGVTPTTLTLRRKAGDCILTVSKSGYADETRLIEQGVNPAYWMNPITSPAVGIGAILLATNSSILLGDSTSRDKEIGAELLIAAASGWLIDYWTGAIHTHRPKIVNVTLRPKE